MKYLTSALVLIALFGAQSEQANAIKLTSGFSDDLIKSLTEDMQKDQDKADEQESIAAAQKEVLKQANQDAEKEKKDKETKKDSAKKDSKKEEKSKAAPAKKGSAPAKKTDKKESKKESKKDEEEIPMDQAAIKAYSSVIADAAEDSEPQTPVVYKKVVEEEKKEQHSEGLNFDPMGSMIQNEITSIKDASIKASKESSDWNR